MGGKLFTMFYAIVGIPLGLVMFQSIGERLNKFSSVVIRGCKRMLGYRDVEASELNLICVVTTLSSLTIAGGAAAFSRYEGWTYFDSVYYCFITLTTIGALFYAVFSRGRGCLFIAYLRVGGGYRVSSSEKNALIRFASISRVHPAPRPSVLHLLSCFYYF